MAYFGFGGGAKPRAPGHAATGSKRATATAGVTGFLGGSTRAQTKAPYSALDGALVAESRAGSGQRFPFTARVITIKEPVLIVDEDGSLIV
jgi:hypothetical protein